MSALIYCPFPDREAARKAAELLLDEKLIACANILGEIESLFEWNGQRETAQEVAALFKTDSAILARSVARLGEVHPYDMPVILGWECNEAHPSTAEWLGRLGANI